MEKVVPEAKGPTKEQRFELLCELNAIVQNNNFDNAGWAVPWRALTDVGNELGVLQTPQLIDEIRKDDEFNLLMKKNPSNAKDKEFISGMFNKWKDRIDLKIKEPPIYRAKTVSIFYTSQLERTKSIGNDSEKQLEWLMSLKAEAIKKDYDFKAVTIPGQAPSVTRTSISVIRHLLGGLIEFVQTGKNVLAQVPEGILELRSEFSTLSVDLTENELIKMYDSTKKIIQRKIAEIAPTRIHSIELAYFILNNSFVQFEKNPSQYIEKLRQSEDLLLQMKNDSQKKNEIYQILNRLKENSLTVQSSGLSFWQSAPDGVVNLRQHLANLKEDMLADELFTIFSTCHAELSFQADIPNQNPGDPAIQLYNKYLEEFNTALSKTHQKDFSS